MGALKRKANVEANLKNKAQEENDELKRKIEELNRQRRDKDDVIGQKDEEIQRLKK